MDDLFTTILQIVFSPFGLFYKWPLLALIPAVVLLVWRCSQRGGVSHVGGFVGAVPYIAAAGWLVYALWEWHVRAEFPPKSVPIRVDLLLIAPLLYIVTIAGGVACWRLGHSSSRSLQGS